MRCIIESKKNVALLACVLSIAGNYCFAQLNSSAAEEKLKQDEKTGSRKIYTTKNAGVNKITLDGIPSEDAWNAVDWGGDFTQWQPGEGKAPSQQTKFKILYDDRFLYVAYRCFDSAPDSIVSRMGRRDEFPGDWVEIHFDSYHDLRTAFSFTLSVSGVRGDEFISNNGSYDASWNPIWSGKTHIDEEGWTGEIKIPLSQLRYGNEREKTWGFQIVRRLFRHQERSTWVLIPQSSGVWVSNFGELKGLNNIKKHRQIEIAPYITAQLDKYKKINGNPFATGTNKNITVGLDGKVAVTNNLILDFTINPDFGQVEADPSQVRIDGFQNFFPERRPFFIESRNIFDYQLTGSIAGGAYDSDVLFYSRRIGSTPHKSPTLQTGEYADVPLNTSILGAAKFSGKTRKGFSVGILESITQEENAIIDNNGTRSKQLIEPLTSYFVSRLQNDFNGGQTIIGGIFTSVNRQDGLNSLLHKSAVSRGLDFTHFWKKRTWYLRGNFVFSNVKGTKEAILITQRNFEHLFQRKGADELGVDENRTALTGTSAAIRFGKAGGKGGPNGRIFRFQTGLTYRSPQLELNDIGFLLSTNEINHFTWFGLQYPRSFSIFRSATLNYNHWSRWDFGGKFLYQSFNINSAVTFANNYQVTLGSTWTAFEVSNNALRGGSALRRQPVLVMHSFLGTDNRKKFTISYSGNAFWGFNNSSSGSNNTVTFRYQPFNALNASLGIGYNKNWRRQDQFVQNVTHSGSLKSVVSELEQNTWSFTARLNYNISPDITVQYYGQPFITRPLYKNFALVTDPLNKNFGNRFHQYTVSEIQFQNGSYLIDENGDGITDYSFKKPDFNFVQFRSNLVGRWEYTPGSEIFLVWSQGNTPDVRTDLEGSLVNNLFDNLFAVQAKNSFLLKWTYRFVR